LIECDLSPAGFAERRTAGGVLAAEASRRKNKIEDFLEHFSAEEAVAMLQVVRSSMKPGGACVIQTLNAGNLLWGRLRYGDFTHRLAFTASSIRQALLVAGFKHVEVHPQRPVVHGLTSLIRFCFWMLFECLFHFYLLVETGSHKGIFTQDVIVVARK